jgi:antimicrobial peptide system SdpB family protein
MKIKVEVLIKKIDSGIYWTDFLGLSRSLLALGLLLTLVFNSNEILFSHGIKNTAFINCNSNNIISIYCLIKNTHIAKLISVLILTFVIIGLYPKYTSIFHWWVTYSFSSSSYVIDGGDQIASILTLLLIPICVLDKRKWHWSANIYQHNFVEKNIAYFSYSLIAIQAFMLYFHAMIGKFEVNEWLNGSAVYYWVMHPVFGINENFYFLLIPLLKSPIILLSITWSVLFIELILAANIFYTNKKIKFTSLAIGLLFHFMIIIAHGLVSFFFSMASLLLLYLVSKNYNYDPTWHNRIFYNFANINTLFRFSTKNN